MSSDDLERVVAAAQSSTPFVDTDFVVDPFPTTALQAAVASVVSNGESLAVVAASADLPSLAVMNAVDALHKDSK